MRRQGAKSRNRSRGFRRKDLRVRSGALDGAQMALEETAWIDGSTP